MSYNGPYDQSFAYYQQNPTQNGHAPQPVQPAAHTYYHQNPQNSLNDPNSHVSPAPVPYTSSSLSRGSSRYYPEPESNRFAQRNAQSGYRQGVSGDDVNSGRNASTKGIEPRQTNSYQSSASHVPAAGGTRRLETSQGSKASSTGFHGWAQANHGNSSSSFAYTGQQSTLHTQTANPYQSTNSHGSKSSAPTQMHTTAGVPTPTNTQESLTRFAHQPQGLQNERNYRANNNEIDASRSQRIFEPPRTTAQQSRPATVAQIITNNVTTSSNQQQEAYTQPPAPSIQGAAPSKVEYVTGLHAKASPKPWPAETAQMNTQKPPNRVDQPRYLEDQRAEVSGKLDLQTQISRKSTDHHSSAIIERSKTADPGKAFDQQAHRRQRPSSPAEDGVRKPEATPPTIQGLESDQQKPEPSASLATVAMDPELQIQDQMKSEMQQMLDKMREYKVLNPSLFSKVWEEVKKGPPVRSSSSQNPNLAASVSPTMVQQNVPSPPTRASVGASEPDQPSAPPTFPPGFDRGRFPLQRRRRGGSKSTTKRGVGSGEGQMKQDQLNQAFDTDGRVHAIEGTQPAPTAEDQGTTEQRLLSLMTAWSESQGRLSRPDSPQLPPAQRQQPSVNVAPPSTKPPFPAASSARLPATRAASSISQNPRSATTDPKPKIGSTFWPEDKKKALAEAASEFLNSQPGKRGIDATPESIYSLLDQQPSFAQFCDHLAARGFSLDRKEFAQTLLRAVPDLTTYSNQASSNKAAAASTARLPQPPPPPPPPAAPFPLSPRTPPPPSATPDSRPGIAFPQFQDSPYQRPKSITTQVQGDRVPTPSIHAPPANHDPPAKVSQQDQARKRSFAEFIDLSQDLSDEDDAVRNLMLGSGALNEPFLSNSSKGPSMNGEKAQGTRRLDEQVDMAKKADGRTERVVLPLDKRRDALRRSAYDPRTICRDILISSGRHPTEASLNAHLDILRENFECVTFESDLKTLQWEIIDSDTKPKVDCDKAHPGMKNQDPEDHQVFGKPEQTNDSKRRNVPPQTASNIWDSPMAVHISPATPPSRRERPSKHSAESANIQAPMQFEESTPSAKSPNAPFDRNAFIRSYSFNPATATSSPVTASGNPLPAGAPSRNPALACGVHVRIPGRVGRPPGTKNRQVRSDKGVPKKRLVDHTSTRLDVSVDSTPKGKVAASKDSTGGASSPSTVAVLVPSVSPSRAPSLSERSRHGQWQQQSSPSATQINNSKSAFKAYRCGWTGCPSELHDLETLWKHVRKHRTRLQKPFACKWIGCGISEGMRRVGAVNNDLEHRSSFADCLTFESTEAWDKHMMSEHLESLMDTRGS